jgi:hypothetical protein
MKAVDLESVGFAVQVDDEDTTTPDNIAGKSTIKPTDGDLQAGSITIGNMATLPSLTITLTRQ